MKSNQTTDTVTAGLSSAEALKAGGKSETKWGGLAPVQAKRKQTGLPDNLKAGIENLSGHSMDDVKVHYNSSQPAGLQAHAYAQGTDIHVAPGQERHLPHEAWHVVQQKQGRVKPTRQLKGTAPINADAHLEKEADHMGRRAQAQVHIPAQAKTLQQASTGTGVAQRVPTFVDQQYRDEWRNLGKLAQAKLDRVKDDIVAMGTAKHNLEGHLHIVLNICNDGYSMNPASTQSLMNGTIIIDIQDWFIESSSEGKILGVIMHELGVHSLTNREMGPEALEQETYDNVGQKRFKAGRDGQRHNVRLTPVKDGERRQQDHINVGKDKGLDRMIPPRAAHYAETVLTQGDAIWNDDNRRNEEQKIAVLQDMMEAYLFDVARIMATNDVNRVSVLFKKTQMLTDLFNWYKDTVMRRQQKNHPWLQLLNLEKSRSGILSQLMSTGVGFLYAMNKTKFDRTRIGYGLGKIGGYISDTLTDEDNG